MSIDGQDDDYTAWLTRVELLLCGSHAVNQDVAIELTRKAEKDGVLNYRTQRGKVDFTELALQTYMHWIKQ